jgi:hypothetical protein
VIIVHVAVDRSLQKGKNFCMRWGEIRKVVNVKDWEQYSSRWKNDWSQWTTLRKLLCVWARERSSKRKKNIFIRWRSHWRSAKLVKDSTKKHFFLAALKNLWNAWIGALKSRGITLKSDISFVSAYLQRMQFFKSPVTFWLTLVNKNILWDKLVMLFHYLPSWRNCESRSFIFIVFSIQLKFLPGRGGGKERNKNQ